MPFYLLCSPCHFIGFADNKISVAIIQHVALLPTASNTSYNNAYFTRTKLRICVGTILNHESFSAGTVSFSVVVHGCCCCCLTPNPQPPVSSLPPGLGVRLQGAGPVGGGSEGVVEVVEDSENKRGRKQSVCPRQVSTTGPGHLAP